MKTHFVKDRAHPCGTYREEGTQQEMSGSGRGIGQVSKYIAGPEIEKHRDDKTDQPVVTGFQGKAFD